MAIPANIKSIESLKPKAVRYDSYLEGYTGLLVRVQTSGRLSFVHRYKLHGQTFKINYGSYPAISLKEAIARHSKERLMIDRGKNPAAEVQKQALSPTVRELAEFYLEKHAKPNKRSWREDELMLQKDVLSVWGKLKVTDITRAHVLRLVDTITDRGALSQARKVLAVVKVMFGLALTRDMISVDPTLRVTVKQAAPRERSLAEEEIRIFWRRLNRLRIAPAMRDCLRLQLLTGQRIGEICGMEWTEIDFANKVWRLPASRSKNKSGNIIPLSDPAITILNRHIPTEPFGITHVFTSFAKRGHILAGSVAHALSDAMPLLEEDGVLPFTTHDLRRTVTTQLAQLGTPRQIVDRILNHADTSVTGRHYDQHRYVTEMRQALEAWSRKLYRIVRGAKESSVTPFRRMENRRRRG